MTEKKRKELIGVLKWKDLLVQVNAENCGRSWLNSHRKFVVNKSIAPDPIKVITSSYPDFKDAFINHPSLGNFLLEAMKSCFSGKYFIFTKDGVIVHLVYLWDTYLWDIDGKGCINFTIPRDLKCEYLCSSIDTRIFNDLSIPLPSGEWVGKRRDEVYI